VSLLKSITQKKLQTSLTSAYKVKKLFLILILLQNVYHGHSQRLSQWKPNIIIIYLDDLGYGDVGCYGAKGVKTPNVDRLAKHGIKFTDAHSSAATCTPSRFSLLTGSYAFRNKI
jgi:hypothetical protein